MSTVLSLKRDEKEIISSKITSFIKLQGNLVKFINLYRSGNSQAYVYDKKNLRELISFCYKSFKELF
jgi:hypothetical protein